VLVAVDGLEMTKILVVRRPVSEAGCSKMLDSVYYCLNNLDADNAVGLAFEADDMVYLID